MITKTTDDGQDDHEETMGKCAVCHTPITEGQECYHHDDEANLCSDECFKKYMDKVCGKGKWRVHEKECEEDYEENGHYDERNEEGGHYDALEGDEWMPMAIYWTTRA